MGKGEDTSETTPYLKGKLGRPKTDFPYSSERRTKPSCAPSGEFTEVLLK